MVEQTLNKLYETIITTEITRRHGSSAVIGTWQPSSLFVWKYHILHQLIHVSIYCQDKGIFTDTVLVRVPEIGEKIIPDAGFMIEEG